MIIVSWAQGMVVLLRQYSRGIVLLVLSWIRMMKVFKPSCRNLDPRIIRACKRSIKWHRDNGYDPLTLDYMFSISTGFTNGFFTVLILDGGKKYGGDIAIMVFNEKGVLIEDLICYNARRGRKLSKGVFPIIDAL